MCFTPMIDLAVPLVTRDLVGYHVGAHSFPDATVFLCK